MPYIEVTKDCKEWFEKYQIIKRDGRKLRIQENELVILMLNMLEAGNISKQVAKCIKDPLMKFPQRIFEHYKGVFYRDNSK